MEFGPLRQQILQLAVSGQLVEQLDSEPAVEQVGPAPKPDEVPFELPPKWKWVPLGSLCDQSFSGGTPSKTHPEYWGGDIPWASIKDLSAAASFELWSTKDRITKEGLQESSSKVVAANNVIVGMRMGLDKVVINKIPVAINQDLRALYLNRSLIEPDYFVSFYRTLKFEGAGTTVKGIRASQLLVTLVPLPPLEEQRRIVAVVDGLMGRLDQMEQAYSEFAGPMTEHFRNLMLDKAIRGELVPQLDSEPEVEQVGPAPQPDEVPFELPPKWKWVQIEQIFSMQAGKFIKAAQIGDQGLYPCYGANGIRGYVDSFNCEGPCNVIGRVGSCGCVNFANNKIYVTDNAIVATHGEFIDPYCAYYFLTALNLGQYATKTAQPLLNKGTIEKIWFPLAPIEEQHRIVAKLEEVFTGVEKLGSLMEYA